MHDVSLSLVLRRSRSGQAVQWGAGALPALQEHLLMRFNGYTPLRALLHESESADELLDAARQLLDQGLVEPTAEHDDPRWPSSRFDTEAGLQPEL